MASGLPGMQRVPRPLPILRSRATPRRRRECCRTVDGREQAADKRRQYSLILVVKMVTFWNRPPSPLSATTDFPSKPASSGVVLEQTQFARLTVRRCSRSRQRTRVGAVKTPSMEVKCAGAPDRSRWSSQCRDVARDLRRCREDNVVVGILPLRPAATWMLPFRYAPYRQPA